MHELRLFSGAAALAMTLAAGNPASAYPIDCAILLCLGGGFPPSAECTAAKAEMIRRVTPWPIEPPLQVWRCPMGGNLPSSPETGADIPLGGREFDFIRAMKVYAIDYAAYSTTTHDGDRDVCHVTRNRNQIGEYDDNGAFTWSGVRVTEIPQWTGFDLPAGETCPIEGRWRGVSIGFEAPDEDGSSAFETETFRY